MESASCPGWALGGRTASGRGSQSLGHAGSGVWAQACGLQTPALGVPGMSDTAGMYSTVVTGKLRLKKSSKKQKQSKATARASAPSAPAAPSSASSSLPAGASASGLGAPARRGRRQRPSEPSKRAREEASDAEAHGSPKRTRADEDAEADALATAEAEAVVAKMKGLTPAQRRLEVLRIKQECRTDRDRIGKSHRERMDELNEKLESLPIHFDVPKVAAAGQG